MRRQTLLVETAQGRRIQLSVENGRVICVGDPSPSVMAQYRKVKSADCKESGLLVRDIVQIVRGGKHVDRSFENISTQAGGTPAVCPEDQNNLDEITSPAPKRRRTWSLCELPECVLRMVPIYLDSSTIARLTKADRGSHVALSFEGVVAELMLSRGYKIDPSKATALAQLHVSENLSIENNYISFEFMSCDISEAYTDTLDNIARLFRIHPGATGRIETHAQPGAPAQIAKQLCHARADAVCEQMMERRVNISALRAGGFGTSRPLAGASADACRRAEVFLDLGGLQFPAEHRPVVAGDTARWIAWARGEATSASLRGRQDGMNRMTHVQTASDSDDDLSVGWGWHLPELVPRASFRRLNDETESTSSESSDSSSAPVTFPNLTPDLTMGTLL